MKQKLKRKKFTMNQKCQKAQLALHLAVEHKTGPLQQQSAPYQCQRCPVLSWPWR